MANMRSVCNCMFVDCVCVCHESLLLPLIHIKCPELMGGSHVAVTIVVLEFSLAGFKRRQVFSSHQEATCSSLKLVHTGMRLAADRRAHTGVGARELIQWCWAPGWCGRRRRTMHTRGRVPNRSATPGTIGTESICSEPGRPPFGPGLMQINQF